MGDPAERETVVSWTGADEGMAHVYTSDPRMMRRLSRHPKAKLVETHMAGKAVTEAEYDLPLECIVHLRAGRRRVSVEQREAAAARMREKRVRRGARKAPVLQNPTENLGFSGVASREGSATAPTTVRASGGPAMGLLLFPDVA